MLSQKSLTSRSEVNCLILEKPQDLKTNVLPTINDLLKYHLHLKKESHKQNPRGLFPRIVDDVAVTFVSYFDIRIQYSVSCTVTQCNIRKVK